MRRMLLLLPIFALAPAPQAAAGDDPKEVVRKAVVAHGGKEKLDRLQGTKSASKGTIRIAGMDLEYSAESVSQLPDKAKTTIRVDIMGNPITIVQSLNGDKMSVSVNGMAQPIPDAQKDDLKESLALQKVMNLTPLLLEQYELKPAPAIDVAGKNAIGIEVSGKDLKECKIYFDKATYLIVRVDRKALDPAGGDRKVNQHVLLSDYREVSGVKKPHKLVVTNDGKQLMSSTVVKMELRERIDEREFDD